jgi:kynurenine 3-monooxygenase
MHKITIIGGGLVGSLFSLVLKRKGYEVQVFERRPDMRKEVLDGGRSINLVITEKGLNALNLLGLKDKIVRETVPVFGRMMHDPLGNLTYQAYGVTGNECNYSISRAGLNKIMINYAETEGVQFNFNQRLNEIDFSNNIYTFQNEKTGAFTGLTFERVFGAEGAPSACRNLMAKAKLTNETITPLGHDYKELVIPKENAEKSQMKQSALHIWPRGHHMLMALPNLDGSFTVTLYLPEQGELSFENLKDEKNIAAYFRTFYPDAIQLIPTLLEDFLKNPVGKLATVRCYPWHYQDKIALIGDAAHGIVPFFGQGMNAGFDDCVLLEKLMAANGDNWADIFNKYSEIQKPNGDAIADMAVANLREMSEKVGDPDFLMQRQVEKIIAHKYPKYYLPRYSMITHTTIPYAICQKVGLIQDEILSEVCKGLKVPEEVNLERAEELIRNKLKPFCEQYLS